MSKRIISMLLMLIMVLGVFGSMTVFANDEENAQITVESTQGFAAQAVKVAIKVDKVTDLSGAQLEIKYDEALTLLKVENGSFFANNTQSAIYEQHPGGVNGKYTYIGFSNGENVEKQNGTFVTLTFMLPEDASVDDFYAVEIVTKQSTLLTGTSGKKSFTATNGGITAIPSSACEAHSFSEYTLVSATTDYVRGIYQYRTCTACGIAQIYKTTPLELRDDIFTYEGVCINYTGNPSGIAPIFTVNTTALYFLENTILSNQENVKVQAGIVVYKNGEYCYEEIFHADNPTISLNEQSKLFVKMENVSVFDKFEFKAYIRVIDTKTGEQRVEYTNATYNDNEQITIVAVAKGLNLKAYEKEDQAYLDKVIKGLAK